VSFDVERAIALARRVKPGIRVIQVSATRGEGMDDWLEWLRAGAQAARALRERSVAALQRRVAELEVLVNRLGSSAA
jgi:hydrogenase nickel incorporation protein HypB